MIRVDRQKQVLQKELYAFCILSIPEKGRSKGILSTGRCPWVVYFCLVSQESQERLPSSGGVTSRVLI